MFKLRLRIKATLTVNCISQSLILIHLLVLLSGQPLSLIDLAPTSDHFFSLHVNAWRDHHILRGISIGILNHLSGVALLNIGPISRVQILSLFQ